MHPAHRTSTGRARRPAHLRPWLLPALLALLLPPVPHWASAQVGPELNIARPPEPPAPHEPEWREEDITLPAFPTAERLVPLPGDAVGSGYTYLIDVDSVSVDEDKVSRYTVVIVSPNGTGNVLYEGIRCDTRESKSYAYGTRAQKFEKMPSPEWTSVYTEGPFGYRGLLFKRYVCDSQGWTLDVDSVLDRLLRNDPSRLGGTFERSGDGSQ